MTPCLLLAYISSQINDHQWHHSTESRWILTSVNPLEEKKQLLLVFNNKYIDVFARQRDGHCITITWNKHLT